MKNNFKPIKFAIFLIILIHYDSFSQGVGVGARIDLTSKLALNTASGQFAQLFIPDYYSAPADGRYMLVFHSHSASWAAEDEVYRSNTNAILFNIHLVDFQVLMPTILQINQNSPQF